MMISDSGLLFWATLYKCILPRRCFPSLARCSGVAVLLCFMANKMKRKLDQFLTKISEHSVFSRNCAGVFPFWQTRLNNGSLVAYKYLRENGATAPLLGKLVMPISH